MKRVAMFLALAACGDELRRPPPPVPVSGKRLKLEWFFYGDGSQAPNSAAYYDTQIHGRCTPQRWVDGELRCTPVADMAMYTNAACTELVGRADVIGKPRFFLGYDMVAGEQLPARLYYAGAMTAAPSVVYERIDGACVGPRSSPPGATYFEVSGETQPAGVVALRDRDVSADDRLVMVLRETDDGLYLPLGLRDRAFSLDCRAAERAGGAVCEPVGVRETSYFADRDCTRPALGVVLGSPAPPLVRVPGAGGCAAYHEVGADLPALYARTPSGCYPAGSALRGYALGPEVALAPLEREIAEAPRHRLQQIAITAGTARLLDDHMFDTATRLDCRRETFEDAVRCVPAATTPALVLYAAGCTRPVLVAELPEATCQSIEFATSISDEGVLEVRALGERVGGVLYSGATGACLPYASPPGTVLRAVGPPIPIDTFVGGHAAGER